MEYSDDNDGDVGVSSVHACFNMLNSLSGIKLIELVLYNYNLLLGLIQLSYLEKFNRLQINGLHMC